MDSGSNSGSLQSSSGGEDEQQHPSRPMPHNPNHPFDPFSHFLHPWPTNPIQPQSVTTTTTTTTATATPINHSLQAVSNQPPTPTNTNASGRNPRKRTRASRRAPTTVLTTDTSNFRAMVQEFTGIPAPPFTPASPFSRPRLDLFGGTSSPSTPPYLLRPFPQKLSPFLSPSSSDFLLPKHNHPIPSIFNLQPNINLLGSHTQTTPEPNLAPHHLHQTPLPGELVSGSVGDGGRDNIIPASWGCGGDGGGSASFRSMNAKYSTDTKLNSNFLPSSSSSNLDFHGDKGSENARSEGMIESWICSSD